MQTQPDSQADAVGLADLAPAIRVERLSKVFGERVAVKELSFEVPQGVVCGFVGPNGAGKTTTIRMLLAMARPTSGHGFVLGQPIEEPTRYLTRVGALIELPAFYPTLSGRRNLQLLAEVGGLETAGVAGALDRVGLSSRGGDLYRSYSLGMKQRLGIAAALLPDPDLLVLDEPTNGLDPAGIMEVRALLRELSSEGKTIFVSSHLLSEVEFISDWLVMIKAGGELLFEGPIHEALAHQQGRLIAAGEHAADLRSLLRLVEAIGYDAEVTDDQLLIDAPPEFAAELNRRAMADGLVLAELHYERPNLEEMFLTMTKEDDHAL